MFSGVVGAETFDYLEEEPFDVVFDLTNDDVNEIKNSDIPIMDSNSFGSTYTKLKVVNVKPKYEFEKIGKTKEIGLPKEESKEETQISFEDFTNSFKI